MKSTFAASLAMALVSFAAADFHILEVDAYIAYDGSAPGSTVDFVGCPSNYFNCKCFFNDDRTGVVDIHDDTYDAAHYSGSTPDYFTLQGEGHGDFCGVGQLDFYKRDDGHFDVYLDGGNGDVVGTCYRQTSSDSVAQCHDWAANVANVYDRLVCYSYICGSA